MKKLVGTSIMFAMIVTLFACFYGCSSDVSVSTPDHAVSAVEMKRVSVSMDVPRELKAAAEFLSMAQKERMIRNLTGTNYGEQWAINVTRNEFGNYVEKKLEDLVRKGSITNGKDLLMKVEIMKQYDMLVRKYGENTMYAE